MKKYFVLFYVGVVSSPAFAQTKMLTEDSLRWESFRREQQVIQQAVQVDYQILQRNILSINSLSNN